MFLDELKKKAIELEIHTFEKILTLFDLIKLEKYYNFLCSKNEEGGFFSKNDESKILQRHILEPLVYIFEIQNLYPINVNSKILDVGTGPGIPGYFFFCLKISPIIFLNDSQIKRLKLLKEFHELNFDTKIHFLFDRAENIKNSEFDFIFMRSTIPYPWSAELIHQLISKSSKFIPFLAKNKLDFGIEKDFLKKLGLITTNEIELTDLKFLGERRFKVIEKFSNPVKGFPRTWDKISKEIKKING